MLCRTLKLLIRSSNIPKLCTNMSEKEFQGKVVLITGSSSGIGAAAAVEFARLGASVSITGRNQAKLEEIAKACQEVSPFKIQALVTVGDVTNEDDNQRLVENTLKVFGKLDVLVNNAGGAPPQDPNFDLLTGFDIAINTNLRSVYHITKLAIPHLVKTKGNIINISTIGSLKCFTTYYTAKSGLDHLSRCLALELAPKGVRVNVINPGPVRTNFLRHLPEEQVDAAFEGYMTPLGSIGVPQDIANIIVFLASDKASFVTGACFAADGGLSLGQRAGTKHDS